ncbi:MAG: DUF3560 domain-containing protein [Deltaproteobacteria bacterium]|nr:DUF3560 domain-containing protein [Deltaproteobacteria bacterium]
MATSESESTAANSHPPEVVVRYRYRDGVLLEGNTKPHKDRIKTARPRWRWFRSLRQWGIPRSRERAMSRDRVQTYVDGLRRAGVPGVGLDYQDPEPDDVRDFLEVLAEEEDRAIVRAEMLDARADALAAKTIAEHDKSRDIVSGIPMGQPILVGHHSQRRHERAIERSSAAMDRAVEADRQAKRARRGARVAQARVGRRESPPFAIRRLRELEAELRKLDVEITGKAPKGWRGQHPGAPATGSALVVLQTQRRQSEQQQAYFRSVLEADHVPATPDNLRAEDPVMTERGPGTVEKVSAKMAKVVLEGRPSEPSASIALSRLWVPKTTVEKRSGGVSERPSSRPALPSPASEEPSPGNLWTTDQEGFALVSPKGDGQRVQVPTSTQPPLFDMGKPDREVMEQRRADELAERRAKRGPVDDAAPLFDAAPVLADRAPEPAPTGEAPDSSPAPMARLEYVDVATGEPTAPSEPGTRSTGRIVADIDGEVVPIDEEDLVGHGTGADPRRRRYRYDTDSPADYPGQARAKKAARAAKKKTSKKRRARIGQRKTFDSAAKAAKTFYDNNEDFFDHVRDPWDGLRDWMDGIEVAVGRGHRTLSKTATGKRILGERHAAKAIRQAIAYVLGRAKGRRWDAVPWVELDRLGEALQRDYEAPTSGPGQPGLYWRPFTGTVGVEDLDAMTPAQRESVRQQESAKEIDEQLGQLRDAYARAKACLPDELRRTIARRIRQWSAWVKDPAQIPDYACEPDPKTAGYLCNYPAVAGELAQLRRSCEGAYDPDWAADDSKRAVPGFPDTSGGEDDARRSSTASAKACCSSRAAKPAKKSTKPRTPKAARTRSPKPPTAQRRRATERERKYRDAQRRAKRLACSAAVVTQEVNSIDLAPYRVRVETAKENVNKAVQSVRERERELAVAQRDAQTTKRSADAKPIDRQRARRRVTDARCQVRLAKGEHRQKLRDEQRARTELRRAITRWQRREAVAIKKQRAAKSAEAKAATLAPSPKRGPR